MEATMLTNAIKSGEFPEESLVEKREDSIVPGYSTTTSNGDNANDEAAIPLLSSPSQACGLPAQDSPQSSSNENKTSSGCSAVPTEQQSTAATVNNHSKPEGNMAEEVIRKPNSNLNSSFQGKGENDDLDDGDNETEVLRTPPRINNSSRPSSLRETPTRTTPSTAPRTRTTTTPRSMTTPTPSRPAHTIVRQTDQTLRQMERTLLVAAEELMDRLLDYIVQQSSSTVHHGTKSGITLPASAVAWLSFQVLEARQASNVLGVVLSGYRLSQLKASLPHCMTHVRLTGTPWPTITRSNHQNRNSNNTNTGLLVGAEEDTGPAVTTPPSSPTARPNMEEEATTTTTSTAETTTGTPNITTSTAVSPSVLRLHDSLEYMHRLRYSPRVDLRIFPQCQVLILDQVAPEWIVNLSSLRSSLQVLRIERAGIYDLHSLLIGDDDTTTTATTTTMPVVYWQLTHFKLSYCAIGEHCLGLANVVGQDGEVLPQLQRQSRTSTRRRPLPIACLSRLPNLESLCLSHNEIRSEATALGGGLKECHKLATLDLSYNFLTCLKNAHWYLGNIQTLLLTGNKLQSATGIDRLVALQHLAIDDNDIQNFKEVTGLARLPELQTLRWKGNPLVQAKTDRKYYRVMLLDLFREQRCPGAEVDVRRVLAALPVVDDKPATERELKKLQQRTFPIVNVLWGVHGPNFPIGAAGMVSRSLAGAAKTPISAASTFAVDSGDGATGVDMGHNLLLDQRAPAISNDQKEPNNTMPATAPVTPQHSSPTAAQLGEVSVQARPLGSCWDNPSGRCKRTTRKRKPAKAVILEKESDALVNTVVAARAKRNMQSASTTTKIPRQKTGNDESGKVSSRDVTMNGSATGRFTAKIAPKQQQSGAQPGDLLSGNSFPPKVKFSVAQVVTSLNEDDAFGKTTDSQGQSWMQATNSLEATNDRTAEDKSNDSGVGSADEEFAWPEPIKYVPEYNLYGEWDSDAQKISSKWTAIENSHMGGLLKAPDITTPDHTSAEASMANKGEWGNTRTQVSGTGATKQANIIPPLPLPENFQLNSMPAAKGSVSVSQQLSVNPECENQDLDIDRSILAENGTVAGDIESRDIVDTKQQPSSADCASFGPRSVSSDEDDIDKNNPTRISGLAFLDNTWDENSSLGTNKSKNSQQKFEFFDNVLLAELNSLFVGLENQRQLVVSDNLELYFRVFVFPEFVPDLSATSSSGGDGETWKTVFFKYPRIQMSSSDRSTRDSSRSAMIHQAVTGPDREQLIRVWKENIIACGKPSLRRLTPNRTALFGFHGTLTFEDGKVKTISQPRVSVLCLSDAAFYIILDNDTVTDKLLGPKPPASPSRSEEAFASATPKRTRKFPSPIPSDAKFEQALWPHAVACHPLTDLLGITIGFGFQRLTVRFANKAYPSAVDYTYQLITSNKLQTVSLLQELQNLAKEARIKAGLAELGEEPVKIDNDDKQFLDALAAALAPDMMGVVLHYQILKQRWKHGQRGVVGRACIVTDSKLFLLDEEYVGDGSESIAADSSRRLGSPAFRLVDKADLVQVAEVLAADADPNAITIVVRPASSLKRTKRWRLLCRDRTGAERLVEDVRKAVNMLG